MASFNNNELNNIISEVNKWVKSKEDIYGLALVGSYARGNANDRSDIDFLVLTSQKESYRENKSWVNEINWKVINFDIQSLKEQDYGLVWSCHIYLSETKEIEMGFGDRNWIDAALIDEGTKRVIKNGFKIIYDSEYLLKDILEKVQ